MRSIKKLSVATPDAIHDELLTAVENLHQTVGRTEDLLDDLQHVRDLLDALPLATGVHGAASNRLRNAHFYVAAGENGAAKYELRLLAAAIR